jgi:hypothetical protein
LREGFLFIAKAERELNMPRECAFCPNTANKSGEHIWSQWMDDLFPFKKRFIHMHPVSRVRRSVTLDWTVKAVCENCNNTWMSDIESKYAKPVMTPLILGHTGVAVTQSSADAISRFAFKTAVVLDHLARTRQPFFARYVRHGFRKSHAIPGKRENVACWVCAL